MIDMVNAIRINGKALPELRITPEELMRKMPPVFDGARTLRGNVQLNINVNGKTVSQSTVYGDDEGNIHSKPLQRKIYTVDMLPPGQDEPEKMVAELNAMDPDQAEKMLNALIALNDLNKELADLNNALTDNAEEPEPARNDVYARAERSMEQEKANKREMLTQRIRSLEKERDNVTGIFAGMKRKKIQKEIDMLKEEIRRL